MFRNPFSPKGRIRRSEYCVSIIIYGIAALFVNVHAETMGLFQVLYFPIAWLLIALTAKRCHDKNKSGFYQIIPFYGFYLLFSEGSKGKNDYGPDPVFNFFNNEFKGNVNLGQK